MDAVVRPVKPCGKFSLVGEAISTIVIDHPHHGRHNDDLDCWTRHHCQPFHHDLFKPTMIKITIVVINLQTENHDMTIMATTCGTRQTPNFSYRHSPLMRTCHSYHNYHFFAIIITLIILIYHHQHFHQGHHQHILSIVIIAITTIEIIMIFHW